MNEIILKFKRLLNIFYKKEPTCCKKPTPIYIKKDSIQSQVDKYTDNYSPINKRKNK